MSNPKEVPTIDHKKRLRDSLDYMTDEQCQLINRLINTVSSNYISKGQLMKLAYDDTNGIDSALPIDYVRQIEKIMPTFKTFWYCFNYNKPLQLDNIAEEIFNKLHSTFQND